MLIYTYLSEKVGQRAFFGLGTQVWLLPCTIALIHLPSEGSRWATYAVLTVLLSYPTPHPIQVGWCSRISNTVRTRTVSAALYNMSVQLSSVISSNIYRSDDRANNYRRGNTVLASIAGMNIALYLLAKAYYTWRNKQKERKWSQLSQEEKAFDLKETTDEGNKRLDFRFVS
jgi:hypothetical protein